MKESLKHWKSFCPYLRYFSEYSKGGYQEFLKALVFAAELYGEKSLGRQILEGKITKINNDYIFSAGFFGDKKYTCVGRSPRELNIVGFDYPEEWDITDQKLTDEET